MKTTIKSIIFIHWSQNRERSEIAEKCLKELQKLKEPDTEIVVVNNCQLDSHFSKYADVYETTCKGIRTPPGVAFNRGVALSQGEYIVMYNNDIFPYKGWLKECIEIVEKYHCLATPVHPSHSVRRYEEKRIDGHRVNRMCGSNCLVFKRKDLMKIGLMPEKNVVTDGVQFFKKFIRMGYTVMLTKRPMATDLGFRNHSY